MLPKIPSRSGELVGFYQMGVYMLFGGYQKMLPLGGGGPIPKSLFRLGKSCDACIKSGGSVCFLWRGDPITELLQHKFSGACQKFERKNPNLKKGDFLGL